MALWVRKLSFVCHKIFLDIIFYVQDTILNFRRVLCSTSPQRAQYKPHSDSEVQTMSLQTFSKKLSFRSCCILWRKYFLSILYLRDIFYNSDPMVAYHLWGIEKKFFWKLHHITPWVLVYIRKKICPPKKFQILCNKKLCPEAEKFDILRWF